METGARVVSHILNDGASITDVQHMMDIYGSQNKVLISGRPPFCLGCNRIGQVRRQFRTPRANEGRLYGRTTKRCVVTYADKLLQGQESTIEREVSANLMDVTEDVDASGGMGQSGLSVNLGAEPTDPSEGNSRQMDLHPVPPNHKRQDDS